MRVRVYAVQDPLTKKRHPLVQVVPARWPRSRPRPCSTAGRRRRTLDGSPNTLELYRTHARNHISPLLGT
ncbi:MAG: hypothetical protein QOG20_968 [Pseudonocardiales bacterium]|jgi:hypothetical protein|nr:hypothetical protein [Pseudonocardiales bacterium]